MLVRRAVSVLLALSLALAGPTQGSQDAIVAAPTDEQALATDAKPLADKMGWELTRAMDYLKEQNSSALSRMIFIADTRTPSPGHGVTKSPRLPHLCGSSVPCHPRRCGPRR
jgi:hypothetical protein